MTTSTWAFVVFLLSFLAAPLSVLLWHRAADMIRSYLSGLPGCRPAQLSPTSARARSHQQAPRVSQGRQGPPDPRGSKDHRAESERTPPAWI